MNEPKGGEEFVLIDAGWFQLEAGDHGGQQLAARGASLGDQQIEVSCLLRARDALRAVEVFAQALDPDPSLDQPQDVGPGVMGLQHELREVDESADRSLDVTAATSLELLALALRGPVGATECPVEDLDRVVGGALQGLDAERHQHWVAPLGRHPGDRLVGLLPTGLREPRPPIRRKFREIEPVSSDRLDQESACRARDASLGR
jgi:hypothetical protein